MNARTRQPTRGAASGRFPRHGATPRRSRPTTRHAAHLPSLNLGRRPSQTATERALGRLKTVRPGSGAGTKTGRGGAKGTAGLAALAGAAAFAFKNREKLTGLFSRDESKATPPDAATRQTTEPAGDAPPQAA